MVSTVSLRVAEKMRGLVGYSGNPSRVRPKENRAKLKTVAVISLSKISDRF